MTDPAVIADWVRISCASQGLPVKVTDQALLGQVAGLLGAPPRPTVGSAPSDTAPALGTPEGREPASVELVVASSGGCDGDVVEDGRDDRMLTGQRQRLPAPP